MTLASMSTVDLVFYALLLYVALSGARRAVQSSDEPPVLSGRTFAGIALALAALFAPQPPPVVSDRRAPNGGNTPQIAQEPPDAGTDASVPACVPVPPASRGALLAPLEEHFAAQVHDATWPRGGG